MNDRPIAGPAMIGRMRGTARVPLPPVDPMIAKFSMDTQLPSAHQVGLPAGRIEPMARPAWPLIVIALSMLAILLSIGALVA